MANRHLSRSLAMQALFEWDFGDGKIKDLDETIDRIVAEFAPGLEEKNFIKEIASGVIKHRAQIDKIIEKAAPDWPLEQIATVDRNVLRLGLYELIFGDRDDVPAKVAINEAIELAKTFGGENSGRFVNGVLGTVYKEMGEPGKDDTPAKKKKIKDIPYEEMPIEKLGGAVVFCEDKGEIKLAFVHDVFGFWTLTKGHIEEGESVKEGIKREAKEELGLDVVIGQELGSNEYIASDPEKGKTRRQVKYYLAKCEPGEIKLAVKGGLDGASWFTFAKVPELKIYDDIVPIITKAIKILAEKVKNEQEFV
ncbi:MAG TPA: transcription antitermination factor NusB [Candidatus Paceibacterota bacterium]|jgi:transcription antitermination protein NusB|nr:transcription antitermination factor NusB [Candidatus Paceibacterota bacterium]HOH11096.1 transcription antitermination factor NusB [Candidatus Paceibacterota bacterium]HOY11072.1 transcription antitermination factor NusB [Candidatus Paceibacterota bacterium]HPB60197.1 transcription antitermination factor NusB [Candidatus Paceibacterota bacterium]HPN89518.1 transcription antitermination factor NusB [Candidatus Paceibacterota bacterium]